MTDWGGYILSGLIGVAIGWCVCSIWAVRAIDSVRRQLRGEQDYLDKIRKDQEQFYQRAREVEDLFNHTRTGG